MSCLSAARVLDGLASQALPREDASEEDRRAAAARVLLLRGRRALFLARHQAHHGVWNEVCCLF